MRKNHWLRYGLGALVATGAAMSGLLIACGDDDSGTAPRPDSGTTGDTGTTPPSDSGTPDARPPGPPPAKIQIVNAATDLGPDADLAGNNIVRICFASAGVVVTAPPLPNEGSGAIPPGIPIGIGGSVPSFGLPLDQIAITPYVMNGKTLAAKGNVKGGQEVTCDKLVGSGAPAGALTENVDYWKLTDIPAGTLKSNGSFALVLSGCAANTAVAPEKCGAGFTAGAAGVGNLKVTVYELDNMTTVPGTSIGVQFVHAAAASDPFLATALGGNRLPIQPGIAESPDGGAATEYRNIGDGGAVAVGQATPFTQMQGVTLASELAPNPGAYAVPAFRATALKLAQVQALSYPTGVIPDGGEYRNGAGFVFFAVGDLTAAPYVDATGAPADAGGTNRFNTRTFHYLGFPTNPNIPRFQ